MGLRADGGPRGALQVALGPRGEMRIADGRLEIADQPRRLHSMSDLRGLIDNGNRIFIHIFPGFYLLIFGFYIFQKTIKITHRAKSSRRSNRGQPQKSLMSCIELHLPASEFRVRVPSIYGLRKVYRVLKSGFYGV